MLIVALAIVVPLLALVLAVLVRDVHDDGYGHRASARSAGDHRSTTSTPVVQHLPVMR